MKILDDIYLLNTKSGANVYLLDNKGFFDLIDTSVFKETDELIDEITKIGFSMNELRYIILTHCHCDHIGGTTELIKRAPNAKIMAHRMDIPYIVQEEVVPGPYHSMMLYEQKIMKRWGINISKVDIVLENDDIIDSIGGLRVLHIPGHTPGSIALYSAKKSVMFVQDVFRNKASKGLVVGVPNKFNTDTKQLLVDARLLLEIPFEVALFGHGEPLFGNVYGQLHSAKTQEEIDAMKKDKKKK